MSWDDDAERDFQSQKAQEEWEDLMHDLEEADDALDGIRALLGVVYDCLAKNVYAGNPEALCWLCDQRSDAMRGVSRMLGRDVNRAWKRANTGLTKEEVPPMYYEVLDEERKRKEAGE